MTFDKCDFPPERSDDSDVDTYACNAWCRHCRDGSGLDIGLVGPVARGASRFENLLAPQKTYWPGGPVDLKTYWPLKKLTGPPKN